MKMIFFLLYKIIIFFFFTQILYIFSISINLTSEEEICTSTTNCWFSARETILEQCIKLFVLVGKKGEYKNLVAEKVARA
jgi:hypothetical protein